MNAQYLTFKNLKRFLVCVCLPLAVVAQQQACSKFIEKKSADGNTPTVDVEIPNPAPNTMNLSESVTEADVESYLTRLEKYLNETKRPDTGRSAAYEQFFANAPALTGLASTESFKAPELNHPSQEGLALDGTSRVGIGRGGTTTEPSITEVPAPLPAVVPAMVDQIVNQGRNANSPQIIVPRPGPGNNGFRGRIMCNQFSIFGQCCNPVNGGGAFADVCYLTTTTGMQCTAVRANNFRINCPRVPMIGERIVGWYCPPRNLNACPL